MQMGETREVMLRKVEFRVGIGASQKQWRERMVWTGLRGVLPVPITVTAPDVKAVPFVLER